MAKRHVSLKDLATELNVSISTVSRALRNHPEISQEMVRKVQDLARARNYTPNPLAMGLLRQETRMIGVIVPDLVTHFFSSVISGIEYVAKQNGYYILISSSSESYDKEVESVRNLLNTRVEGLIVCLSQETSTYEHFDVLVNYEIPLVFFDRVCRSDEVPSVVADNTEAARQVTRHFYENGCRRIAYINGPAHLSISKLRYEGYLQGLKDCHLSFDEELVAQCNLSPEDASKATRKLLRLKNHPDAIFGINDTVIFAAMREIKQFGLIIPTDVALVGFTGEFHSTVVEPSLTSVTHPTFEMGKEAARLFFERIKNPTAPPQQIVMETSLVIRNSSKRK
ncbi:MAG TPA: LacI family transcriptional regulator [Prolixibacteraceae bacterium]|jgi:LacI family transcriptional regulator|nr:LacI family transcriptional regulator [Prolixibacteraceae bacterium]